MTHGPRIAKRQCVVVRPTFIKISQRLVTPTWRTADALQNVIASLCAQLSSRTLEGRCARCRLVQPSFSMPTYSRYIFATRALEVRQVCAGCSPHLSRRTYSEYPASVLRVSGVGPARSVRVWRPSGVWTHASSSAHSLSMHKKLDAHSEWQRIDTVDPACSTNEQRMLTHAQRRTAQWLKWMIFSCAGRALCGCDRDLRLGLLHNVYIEVGCQNYCYLHFRLLCKKLVFQFSLVMDCYVMDIGVWIGNSGDLAITTTTPMIQNIFYCFQCVFLQLSNAFCVPRHCDD